MDTMYANQITVTLAENEVLLHFAQLVPDYDTNGDINGTKIGDEKTIILSPVAFEKIREVIESISRKDKE